MAAKHALNIGKSIVKLDVISMVRIMPVIGARTTAAKNAAMPQIASEVGFGTSKSRHLRRGNLAEPPTQAWARTSHLALVLNKI
jgi:hypothetical protein